MLGNENPRFALQETFCDTDLDKAASNYLKFNAKFYQDRFRKIVGTTKLFGKRQHRNSYYFSFVVKIQGFLSGISS